MPVDADVLPQTINDTAGKVSASHRGQEALKTCPASPSNVSALFSAPGGQLETFCLDFVTLYELPPLGLGLDSAASRASGN